MAELVIHKHAAKELESFSQRPAHALILSGPTGAGKLALAEYTAGQLLGLALDKLMHYPYLRYVRTEQSQTIGIEPIRELQHFMALKTPATTTTSRVVIIEDASRMTGEAQNALLKTLEEPPVGTVLILTCANVQELLPTVRSRCRMISLVLPDSAELAQCFRSQGFSTEDIKKALIASGNLPGLAHGLLAGSEEHPLYAAATAARQILQQKMFERLASVDSLAKQRDLAIDTTSMLQHMARISLATGKLTSDAAEQKWQQIMRASYIAERQLRSSTQPKLALTNLMLNL